MKILVKKPEELESEMGILQSLIEEHSKIQLEGLPDRMRRAKYFSLAMENNKVIAIRAIKRPDIGYIRAIFQHAGILDLCPSFKFETGWSVTLPEYRCKGISSILLKRLLYTVKDNVYSTTRSGNKPPQIILSRNGFEKVGSPFSGREEPLLLWLFNYQTSQWRKIGSL